MVSDCFFIKYAKGKCTKQVIRRNKIALMPRIIATFLNLDYPELYTGHSFRRTSATLLADSGANITALKRHGGWKSDSVAESYMDESVAKKEKIRNLISTSIYFDQTKESTVIDEPVLKRQKIETVTPKEQSKSDNVVFNNCTCVPNYAEKPCKV